ncbi:MAG: protein kinase [Pseudomonadota bacterium]
MLRTRQKLGKYRLEGKLFEGPLASVYRAMDTIHQTRVALKIPHADSRDKEALEDFQKEVRIASRLEHYNVLPVQNASFINGHFVIATPLGKSTLAHRLERRLSIEKQLDLAGQALESVAYAHSRKVIHCDLKPENFILFEGDRLKLADFGFARKVYRTMKVSGSGTLGYIAPEQALGRLMFQSDVFSLGLILYRIFAGVLPEWPYSWPPKGYSRLKRSLNPRMIALIKKSIKLNPKERFVNAIEMHDEFVKARALMAGWSAKKNRRSENGVDDESQMHKRFREQFGAELNLEHNCRTCEGPVSGSMVACPWCGTDNPAKEADSGYKNHCSRCGRGSKPEWSYCAWCYGPGFELESTREYSDKRYVARCENDKCGKKIMRFMRYCPWCKTKVKKKWNIPGNKARCSKCGWGIAARFWQYCGWCGAKLKRKAG